MASLLALALLAVLPFFMDQARPSTLAHGLLRTRTLSHTQTWVQLALETSLLLLIQVRPQKLVLPLAELLPRPPALLKD